MGRFGVGVAVVVFLLAGCGPRTAPVVAPSPEGVEVQAMPAADPAGPQLPMADDYRRALTAGTRTETGAPGPALWRNDISYRIDAELDPSLALVRGTAAITFRNRSPHTLPSIVLNLYQNIFAEGVPRNRYVNVTGGVTLLAVSADGRTLAEQPVNRIPITGDVPGAPVGFSVQGTLARIRLPAALAPGDSTVLVIDWEHIVPPAPSFRTGWEETLGSRVFHVAQWYPQIAMLDDLRGWDATPYLGDGEFYLPYADFDVSITVPVGHLVGATGELMNPQEVLTEEARSRLTAALRSDSVTHIVTDADISAENTTQRSISGQLTWRFSATDVRDFAFATSAGYVWDATRILVDEDAGESRPVLIHALYRPSAPNWGEAARYGQHAMSLIGERLIPYAYPALTIVEGPIGGMEYPGVIFIGKPGNPESLYAVIAHEAAHQWFPMMVGSDEARFAWLDEGLATYLEALTMGDFFDIADPLAPYRGAYLNVAGSDLEVPLMWHTDLVTPYGARTVAAYSKPGILLRSLEWIVGTETFFDALNTLANEWLGRHPTPWDFFSTFERVSGRSLAWFFAPWWFGTESLDLAILEVTGAESGEAVVTIANEGGPPVPAIVTATTRENEVVMVAVGAQAWFDGTDALSVTVRAPGPITAIEIDPQHIFPDVDRTNNRWVE